MQTKDKMNIKRVVQEFYGNSGPELEYINLSIEKKIYTYILLSKFIFEISMFVACVIVAYIPRLYPRFVYEINHESPQER